MSGAVKTPRFLTLFTLLAFILPAAGCYSSGTEELPSSIVVAVVNGRDIHGDEFLHEYNTFKKSSRLAEPKEIKLERMLREGVLNNLINTILLYDEAKKSGVAIPPDVRDETAEDLVKGFSPARLKMVLAKEGQTFDEWKKKLQKNMVIEKFIRTKIAPMINIPESEVKKYYRGHQEEFNVPARVQAYHIMLLTLSEADEVRNELVDGADFSEMARRYSKSPDAADGGDLGVFSRGQMPKEFDDILFRLKTKEISKVVESPYGFHIFKVVRKLKPTRMTYAEASGKIQKEMFNKQMEKKFNEWLKELRKKAKIVIYSDRLYRL
jgi:parvulin-like peptidyl-prolyl isomerase